MKLFLKYSLIIHIMIIFLEEKKSTHIATTYSRSLHSVINLPDKWNYIIIVASPALHHTL